MKTTLLSLKAFFTICLLCLVGGVSASAQNTYTKVTSEDQLVAGGIYVIVNENAKTPVALSDQKFRKNSTTKTNRNVAVITITNNSFVLTNEDIATTTDGKKVYEFVLGGIKGAWTLFSSCDKGFLCAISSSDNYLGTKTETDKNSEAKITIASNGNASIEFTGNYTRNKLFYNKNTDKKGNITNELFSCYANKPSNAEPIQLYRKVGTFPLTTAQYGTYYTEDAFVMPEGVTGYTITSADGKTLNFNGNYVAGKTVPAKTALVLKATEELTANKEYTYTIVNSTAVAPTDNLLHGSVENATTNVEGAKAYYKLASDPTEGLGFYYGAEDGGAFTNGAHKAYLAVKTPVLSQMRGFSFDSMTTGINHVVANAEHAKSTVIYDLNGRRVNSLNAAAKGVYIVNGKKVIVK